MSGNFLAKVGDFLTGGLGEKIVDGIQAYFPPDMSPTEKANLELAVKQQATTAALALHQAAQEERQQFNERVKQLEGTASDLQQFGFLGKVIVFLRGCQRPVWGYLTLYMDLMWFSGKWHDMSELQESAFWVINVLVLGFLFGERAIKNVMPMINQFIERKNK
jgi:hypothetical protein